jgi:hypothetical protein
MVFSILFSDGIQQQGYADEAVQRKGARAMRCVACTQVD